MGKGLLQGLAWEMKAPRNTLLSLADVIKRQHFLLSYSVGPAMVSVVRCSTNSAYRLAVELLRRHWVSNDLTLLAHALDNTVCIKTSKLEVAQGTSNMHLTHAGKTTPQTVLMAYMQ